MTFTYGDHPGTLPTMVGWRMMRWSLWPRHHDVNVLRLEMVERALWSGENVIADDGLCDHQMIVVQALRTSLSRFGVSLGRFKVKDPLGSHLTQTFY